MKKIIFTLFVIATVYAASCSSSDSDGDCGTYNGKQLHKGSEGGCYYTNSSGNKEYVDRSLCKC